jgi:hypothetical protein
VPTLNAGEWFELEASIDFVIQADKPILVGQFLAAEHAPGPEHQPLTDMGTGDPAFTLAVPIRQFRDTYVFLAPDKYRDDYVSIAAPENAVVRIDSNDALAHPLAKLATFGAGWSSVRVPIGDGFHVLTCSEPCGIMVHGYDQYVSYAYPGGLNLVECAVDGDCPPARSHCEGFLCVECGGDDDCPSERPRCQDFVCTP